MGYVSFREGSVVREFVFFLAGKSKYVSFKPHLSWPSPIRSTGPSIFPSSASITAWVWMVWI